MRIAVTYENGQVFQHFGHTEEFKVYEVEDGKICTVLQKGYTLNDKVVRPSMVAVAKNE